jgi:formylglycine-generating enzyme required for sulfatase activity
MIVIPPGEFRMGSPESEGDWYEFEGPQHLVRINYPLAVGRYPLTFEEYDHFALTVGREQPGDEGWGRGRRPVINVSWDDAKAYVAWLVSITGQTYRLLSEAEWEYACRAGTTTRYWWGDEFCTRQAEARASRPGRRAVRPAPPVAEAWSVDNL